MHHRKFISLIASAAIAISGVSATTAQADTRHASPRGNDAAVAVIAGIAALAILGAAIDRHDDGKGKAAAGPKPKRQLSVSAHSSPRGHNAHRKSLHRSHKQRGHAHGHRHGGRKHFHGHGRQHHHGRH